MRASRIYIHIPFCRKACIYCNFHFTTQVTLISAFTEALITEIHQRKAELETSYTSIYFGGGTPSVLNTEHLQQIISAIHNYSKAQQNTEITLEINPEDVSEDRLKAWLQLGINRFSLGVQSLNASELHWMGRTHDISKIHEVLALFKTYNISNYNIDMIFGSGKIALQHWKTALEQWVAIKAPHIAAYQLTVEPKTVLHKVQRRGHFQLQTDDALAAYFTTTHEILTQHGYQHYEISNYALPGFEAQHNSAYWNAEPYIGLGPSAHSFDGLNRRINASGVKAYIEHAQKKTLQFNLESLSINERFNEYILTQLRKQKGIAWDSLQQSFEPPIYRHVPKILEKWNQCITLTNTGFHLNLKGMLMADAICSDLFIV